MPFGVLSAVGRMVIREHGEVVRDGDQSVGAGRAGFSEVRLDLCAVEA